MTPQYAIEATSVSKIYPTGKRANQGISVHVRPGEVVGLIGPNGSGKTTFIRLLLGLLKPDEGNIRVLGEDVRLRPWAVKGRIAYAPQLPLCFPSLTVDEAVRYILSMCGLAPAARAERTREVLDLVGLSEAHAVLGYQLSPGMIKQLLLAMAICQESPILVLDEPTSMVDILNKSRIWRRLRETRRTILIASHDLEEIREVCDRAYLIAEGRIVAEGAPHAISASLGLPVDVSFMSSDEAAATRMLTDRGIRFTRSGTMICCEFTDLSACLAVLSELSGLQTFNYLNLEGPSFEKAVVRILEGEQA